MKNNYKKIIFGILGLALVLILVILFFVYVGPMFDKVPNILREGLEKIEFEDGVEIFVEVAKTNVQKNQGLMNREILEEDSGMIFVYENEQILSFWMKDTLIPLDIIFLDKEKNIVSIKTMQPCEVEPCQTYSSEKESMYAIEVNEGFTKENNISIGQKVNFEI